MTNKTADLWFPACRADVVSAPLLDPDATQLFCLPHAAAGASAYRNWQEMLAPTIEAIPIQLPGRESRFRESLRRSALELAAEMLEPITYRSVQGFSLFGHSMGALLSFELAHALTAIGNAPAHLFVSGLAAPHLLRSRPPVYSLPEPELLSVISQLQGTSPEVLADKELLDLMLPVFRADLEVCDTYQFQKKRPLAVPITALGGRDDPSVSAEQLSAWASLTSASFKLVVFEGGHFYFQEDLNELVTTLRTTLSDREAASSASVVDHEILTKEP